MKASITLGWIAGLAIAASGLFYVTLQVEKMENQLAQLNKKISAEKENIHMLEAEWSYFNRPDRIQKLTETILPDMAPMEAFQFVDINALPFRPDTKDAATAASNKPDSPAIVAPNRELIMIRRTVEAIGN